MICTTHPSVPSESLLECFSSNSRHTFDVKFLLLFTLKVKRFVETTWLFISTVNYCRFCTEKLCGDILATTRDQKTICFCCREMKQEAACFSDRIILQVATCNRWCHLCFDVSFSQRYLPQHIPCLLSVVFLFFLFFYTEMNYWCEWRLPTCTYDVNSGLCKISDSKKAYFDKQGEIVVEGSVR